MNTRGGIVLKFPNLSQAEILAISKALADTEYGFTGSELEVLLKQYDFADENPTMTKYKRLYNSPTLKDKQTPIAESPYLSH